MAISRKPDHSKKKKKTLALRIHRLLHHESLAMDGPCRTLQNFLKLLHLAVFSISKSSTDRHLKPEYRKIG